MELDTLNSSGAGLLATATAAEAPVLDPAYRAKAEHAAERFEGFFIAEMMRQMRKVTREMAGEDSVFNNRINQDMLDMADGVVADVLAGQRAFGVADAILRQILPAEPQRAAMAMTAPLAAAPAFNPAAPAVALNEQEAPANARTAPAP
ncbi:hypothetical protein GPA19_00965 [Azoarcus indigens]|uniref:Flagellar protein FlgJ n=1 Tax=Azoarcus indigens TaxID=29545 RepID=A0A4R6EGY4_9RHOO|nr:rod-binding protein [Azoarcus indigens]NMG63522.1 hypothetical protein [Azoarcus indigens]TDN57073.1 flagellar protein FlgJ [Azoarcus indigens]